LECPRIRCEAPLAGGPPDRCVHSHGFRRGGGHRPGQLPGCSSADRSTQESGSLQRLAPLHLLHDLEGRDHGGVASVLGISLGSSRAHRHTARLRARPTVSGQVQAWTRSLLPLAALLILAFGSLLAWVGIRGGRGRPAETPPLAHVLMPAPWGGGGGRAGRRPEALAPPGGNPTVGSTPGATGGPVQEGSREDPTASAWRPCGSRTGWPPSDSSQRSRRRRSRPSWSPGRPVRRRSWKGSGPSCGLNSTPCTWRSAPCSRRSSRSAWTTSAGPSRRWAVSSLSADP